MVLGVTVAGGAAVGSWLWGYNRENYKFDREMRQKNELKILEFRNVQSQLWREDIRDIISLTEKKMDSYLIVAVLQLDACVGLFTEGRLEPGTPPWLLHFYMMTLSGAFMYLLMAAWFAMHASVVAQCSSVRLLTQFVRLPVPTWQEIEGFRTYGSSYEGIHPAHWMRVPFTNSLAPRAKAPPPAPDSAAAAAGRGDLAGTPHSAKGSDHASSKSGSAAAAADCAAPEEGGAAAISSEASESSLHADPWGLEMHGEHRNIYELTEQPPALRRHILLARKAAVQYQCFDAFARVAMTFGTNQFLCAIGYYSLGYVAVQDGAPWVSWAVVIIMASIAMTMVSVDFSLTRCEQFVLQALILLGLGTASGATLAWALDGPKSRAVFPYVLPVAYVANALWLWRALRSCAIMEQDTGAWLPMKFRAVLYLDVFGWLVKGKKGEYADTRPLSKATQEAAEAAEAAGCAADFHHRPVGPSGQIHEAPDDAFHPRTFAPPVADESTVDDDHIVSGHDKIQPGRLAAKVFRWATWMLILLWTVGLAVPLSIFRDSMTNPLVADVLLEEMQQGDDAIGGVHATIGEDSSGLPELRPVVDDPEQLTPLPGEPELIEVSWPSHSSFVPRALGSNPAGDELLVADDFNVYLGTLKPVAPPQPRQQPPQLLSAAAVGNAESIGLYDVAPQHARLRGLSEALAAEPAARVHFGEGRSCAAMEGQALKDIAVVCAGQASSTCRLLALTTRGQRLTECPIPIPGEEPVVAAGEKLGASADRSWEISQDWLHRGRDESVQSVAVNDKCIAAANLNATGDEFDPSASGCVIVGTSFGRLVQIRAALENSSSLVPERVMHQRAHPSSRGAMTVVENRYLVALWSKYGSISAFDAERGSVVKEWRLPSHIKWLMLTRGGSSLFLLGVRGGKHVELYRFPEPPELHGGDAQRRQPGDPAAAAAADEREDSQ